MKNASAIYWYLFWDITIETLNEKVTEAFRAKNWFQVEFFCKVIALRSMKMDKDKFWEKEMMGVC